MIRRKSLLYLFCVFINAFVFVNSLNCFVCLPSIAGGTISKNGALDMRANISRTWEDRKEAEFGHCTEMSLHEKFQAVCPDASAYAACVDKSTEHWSARTCTSLGPGMQVGCFDEPGEVRACYCVGDMCNAAHARIKPFFQIFFGLCLSFVTVFA